MSAKIQAGAQASAKSNVQPGDDLFSDVGSSDEHMSGNGAASGDADGFLTVFGRKERKNAKGRPHPMV